MTTKQRRLAPRKNTLARFSASLLMLAMIASNFPAAAIAQESDATPPPAASESITSDVSAEVEAAVDTPIVDAEASADAEVSTEVATDDATEEEPTLVEELAENVAESLGSIGIFSHAPKTITITSQVIGSTDVDCSDFSYVVTNEGGEEVATGSFDADCSVDVEVSANGTYTVTETGLTAGFVVEYADNELATNTTACEVAISTTDTEATCAITNTLDVVPPGPTATVHATKIVCDTETTLPNWGDGGPEIQATTAADFVAAHAGDCEVVPWDFEWRVGESTGDGVNPGNEVATGGAAWTSFTSTANVPAGELVWLREQFEDGYIPFSGWTTEEGVSAEFYCGSDVLNYDNYEYLDNLEEGGHYYCVAFNVPEVPTGGSCTIVSDDQTMVGTNAAVEIIANPVWSSELSGDGASWIWADADVTGEATFTRTFNASEAATATLSVAADNSYTVSVNGTPATCDGSGSGNYSNVDTCTVSLVEGTNTITFDVTNEGGAASLVNPAGLYYKLESAGANCTNVPPVTETPGQCVIESDTTTVEGGGPASYVIEPFHDAWTAVIDSVSWIWGDNEIVDPVGETTQTFTKTFTVDGTVASSTLQIAADNSYVVTLNGVEIARDESEMNYTLEGQDTITVPTSAFEEGTNTLVITVTNWAVAGATQETNPAGLKYKLTINGSECEEVENPPAETVRVIISKYLQTGTTSAQIPDGADHPDFPMTSSWSADNIGTGSGSYVLGNNEGGTWLEFSAQTTAMSLGADYTTSEVLGDLVLAPGAECQPGKYRLVGYKWGTTHGGALFNPATTTAPVFTDLMQDRHVIVINEDCDTVINPGGEDTVQVHLYKYLRSGSTTAQIANGANHPDFPLVQTYTAANMGGSGTSTIALGNGAGGSTLEFGAHTTAFSAPADYAVSETTGADLVLPPGAVCEANKYRLVGYQWGNSLAEAEAMTPTTVVPGFEDFTSDKYVIVVNEDCDDTTTPPGDPEDNMCVIVSDTTTIEGGFASSLVATIHSAWTAVINGASWIWGEEPVAEPSAGATETFTKTFTLDGTVASSTLEIAADNSYTVSLNGTQIGSSTDSTFSAETQDTIVIPGSAFVTGGNTLTFTVTNLPSEGAGPLDNPAGLLYKLTINGSDCTVTGGGENPPPTGHATTTTTIVVSPENMHGWSFVEENATGTGALVAGPGTAPLGSGSANLSVNGTGGEYLGAPNHQGTRLADITELSYATYRASGDAALAIALQLNVDADATDANTAWQGRLVYEPYYTETVATGTWQTWNTLEEGGTGNWWFSNGTLAAATSCTQADPCTWAQVEAAIPNGSIHASLGAVGFKAGSGWVSGFDGNVDAFTITTTSASSTDTTIYDFEPAGAVLSEGDDNGGGGGGGSSRSSRNRNNNNDNDDDDDGEVLGVSTDADDNGTGGGAVLGDQVSLIPFGAPNTGEGSVIPTITLGLLTIAAGVFLLRTRRLL